MRLPRFGSSPPPPPPPPPPLPTMEDPAIDERRRRARLNERSRKGRGATILTGAAGLAEEPGVRRSALSQTLGGGE